MLKISPEVLKWAITTANLKEEDIIKKLNISKKKLDEWLSGKKIPTFNELEKLSKITKREISLFFLDRPPQEPRMLLDYRLGKHNELSIKSLEIIRRIKYFQKEIHNLYVETNKSLPPKIEYFNLNISPVDVASKYRNILRINKEIISEKNLKDEKIFDLLKKKIEQLNIIILNVPIPDEDGIKGFSLSDLEPYIIVINKSDEFIKSKIFTLLHEFAHLILKQGNGFCNPEILDSGHEDIMKLERWCNIFASHFLMEKIKDEELIVLKNGKTINDVDEIIKKLSEKFHLSKSALYITLYQDGILKKEILNEYFKKEYVPVGKKFKRRPKEYKKVIEEYGEKTIKTIFEAKDEGYITTNDVLTLLSIKVKDYEMVRSFVNSRE
jgi:Zn-dependent peptidase ImmA (M78 family)